MSQTSRAIFGAIAVSLTCGAVQFASGRDLSGLMQNSPSQNSLSQNSLSQNSSRQNSSVAPEASINRAAKADRVARIAEAAAQTRTISLRLDGLSDTSVLVRIPAAREARNTSRPPLVTKSGKRKLTVACEPVVSVLTEVAKQLEPGRCVT
jgi:hypothetical protein